jgi:DNA-binding SARP family transcriptional activator
MDSSSKRSIYSLGLASTVNNHEYGLADRSSWEALCTLLKLGGFNSAAQWLESMQHLYFERQETAAFHAQASPSWLSASASLEPSAADLTRLPVLSVNTLGQFQITRGDNILAPLAARKSLTIFRYLLTCDQYTCDKYMLMETSWPDASPEKANHRLHAAVSTLRDYLNPTPQSNYLLYEVDHYRINPDATIKYDAANFRQLCNTAKHALRSGDLVAAQQSYCEALRCYQSDYYVDNGDLTWAINQREQLLALYLAALDTLGQIYIAQHNYEQAIECYKLLLKRDEYREDAHRHLMRSYWQLGRRSDAIAQFKQCRLILAEELALSPMQETIDLHELICNNEPDAASGGETRLGDLYGG